MAKKEILPQIKWAHIGQLVANPHNPRFIKDEKFKELVKSIKNFPEMLHLRPIVVNKDMVVLGGNMRLKACADAGLENIPYILADELTEEQQREFIIKDNVGFGEWDNGLLLESYTEDELIDWGLDIDFQKLEDKDVPVQKREIPDFVRTNILISAPMELKEQIIEALAKFKEIEGVSVYDNDSSLM